MTFTPADPHIVAVSPLEQTSWPISNQADMPTIDAMAFQHYGIKLLSKVPFSEASLTALGLPVFKHNLGIVMQTIVLASQKGGSGKTTLASHLAVEAQASGKSVVLIDTDPQGGLSDWWNVRSAETPGLSVIGNGGLKALLAQLKKAGIDIVIVDTPGQASADTEATIRLADLVVIPVKATPNDLRAVVKTVLVVNSLGRPMIFVVNEAKPKTRLTIETAVELSQHGTVCPTIIHNRQDLAASMIDGRTAGELDPASKSTSEIQALWGYITQRLTMEKSFGTAA